MEFLNDKGWWRIATLFEIHFCLPFKRYHIHTISLWVAGPGFEPGTPLQQPKYREPNHVKKDYVHLVTRSLQMK
jgi:hypothetical protein